LRALSAFDAAMVIVGSVVGAGVFVVSAYAAKNVASPGALLCAWLVGGLLALSGALCTAELGAMFPRGGGDYVYLRAAFGAPLAFLSGWTSFCVVFPGAIAALAAAFGRATLTLVDADVPAALPGTLAIALLTAVNCGGVLPGKWTQNVLSAAKLVAFAALLVLGALSGKGNTSHFQPLWGDESASGFALALVPVAFAYSGWNAASYVAGEIRAPEKNLARALLFGTLGCGVLYLIINVIYLYALPLAEIAGAKDVAASVAARLYGGDAGTPMTALVLVVVGSSLQANILTGPRVYQAMGEDGVFFSAFARLHARTRVPAFALVVQAVLACALLWSGGFESLLNFTTAPLLLFGALTVSAVVVLRVRAPALLRPYKTPLYPLLPLLFVASTVWVLGNVVAGGAVEALYGLAVVVVGLPVYAILRAARRSRLARR